MELEVENFTSSSFDSIEFQLEKEEGHTPWNVYFNFIVICGSCFIGLPANSLVVFLVSKYFQDNLSLANILILILALVDFWFLVTLPIELVYWVQEEWIFGTFICKVYLGLFKLKPLISVFILVWLALDLFQNLNGFSRSKLFRWTFIILVTTTLMIPLMLVLISMYVLEIENDNCTPSHDVDKLFNALNRISIALLFPTVILLALVKFGIIWKSSPANFGNPYQLKTAVTLTLCHLICWMPQCLVQGWFWYGDQDIDDIGKTTLEIILLIPFCLLAINSAANPILVIYSRDDFRRYTSDILCIRKVLWRNTTNGADQLPLGVSGSGIRSSSFD